MKCLTSGEKQTAWHGMPKEKLQPELAVHAPSATGDRGRNASWALYNAKLLKNNS